MSPHDGRSKAAFWVLSGRTLILRVLPASASQAPPLSAFTSRERIFNTSISYSDYETNTEIKELYIFSRVNHKSENILISFRPHTCLMRISYSFQLFESTPWLALGKSPIHTLSSLCRTSWPSHKSTIYHFRTANNKQVRYYFYHRYLFAF